MHQSQLIIETMADALDDVIRQLGGYKEVGNMLWPEKTVRDAANELTNCLNPEHNRKLSFEQIELILSVARKKNIHTFGKWFGDKYGYKFIPVEPDDEKAELQKQFMDMVQVQKQITQRLEQLSAFKEQGA